MSKKGFKKRFFASIFSFYFVVFQFFVVPNALAFGPSFDLFGAGWEPVQKILNLIQEVGEGAMKTSVSTALSYFLQTMAKDVAQGLVSGSTGQEPLFRVETFTTSLKNAADNATGVFLDDLSDQGFDTLGLCKPVDIGSVGSLEKDVTNWLADTMEDLTNSLNLVPDFGDYDITGKTPTCTLSKVVENMQDNVDRIFNYYFEYLFLDTFKKNCNIENIREFENNFSNVIISQVKFDPSMSLDIMSFLPNLDELSGAMQTLEGSSDFECNFFVCKNKNESSCSGDDVNWDKTSRKLIGEILYSVIINSLQMAFGGADFSGNTEETIEFQVTRRCYNMVEEIDDKLLIHMVDPKGLEEGHQRYLIGLNIDLFNNTVKNMDPYYNHVNSDYLEHFKKCVYLENSSGNGPSFITEDSEGGEEENCWIEVYKNDKGIKYKNSNLVSISNTDDYKTEIKTSLVDYCLENSLDRMAFFPQIIREEYNKSLEKIAKANQEKRDIAEKETEVETPNEEMQGTTDQISEDKTGTSTQTTQMTEGYQNSLQDFLTPSGDVWLDAGKLFLSTLLEGYFEELKDGIFQLPKEFAYNDFENFGDDFVEQFNESYDWFEDTDWGDALVNDLVGVPETGSSTGQACIMNSNCSSGICEFLGSDKVCVECIDDSDCEEGEICSSETLSCELE
ncbi:hypothetical protein K9M42_02210 [Patescibacteria group bacterium]|nr:hypothetical protein [Patescibacteria group bacterium]